MVARLWKRRTVDELTAAMVAFTVLDSLGHDDSNALSGAGEALSDWTSLGSRAFDGDSGYATLSFNDNSDAVWGMHGVQCPGWQLVV